MEEALNILSIKFNTTPQYILQVLQDKFNNNNTNNTNNDNTNNDNISYKKDNIILPYYGNIIKHKCKALIYNHGLYTQCVEEIDKDEYCKKCKIRKYGSVYDRKLYGLGKYVTPNGKKEIDYNSFIIKMNYDLTKVDKILKELDISFVKIEIVKNIDEKKRGRPKKVITSDLKDKTIEVERIEINGVSYLKTGSNVILDSNSYEIVGGLVGGEMEWY